MLDFRRAAMSQVEWGPSMETANGTRQNVNGGKLENNILVQEIDLSYASLPSFADANPSCASANAPKSFAARNRRLQNAKSDSSRGAIGVVDLVGT